MESCFRYLEVEAGNIVQDSAMHKIDNIAKNLWPKPQLGQD